MSMIRSRWAAVGAAVAVTLGAGGISLTQAAIDAGEKPVYVALDAPCRVIDTRSASPISSGDANALTVQITGANGDCTGPLAIPGDAVAVATNVTAIRPDGAASGGSFFTVYPADAARPTTSNLNFVNGQPPTPNKVDVGLSTEGKITIYIEQGAAHAAVDIFGYYIDHHHDDRYYTRAQADTALGAKADAADVYTKGEVDTLLSKKANVSIVAHDQRSTVTALTNSSEPVLSANVTAGEATNLLVSAAVEVRSDGGDNDNVNCNIDVDGANGVRQSMDLADAGFDNSATLTLIYVFPVAAGAHTVIVECNQGYGSASTATDRSLSVLGTG